MIDASKWVENSTNNVPKTQSMPGSTRVVRTYKPPFPQQHVSRVLPQHEEVILDESDEEESAPQIEPQPHLIGLHIDGCSSVEEAYDKNRDKIHFKIE
jgi:hypothetical protein